ncbi:hypothetical protein ACIQXV_27355 [Neobacillus sp. NPDC097160]|uniref:hypothetical protein n=1 Tax=Neobacillus sp. NPDC097160 TaxID=3364298 RepID=UPI0037F514D0
MTCFSYFHRLFVHKAFPIYLSFGFLTFNHQGKKQVQAITEKVEQVKTLVSEKNFSEAQALVNELKQDESVKDVFASFSEEVGKLEVTINEEIKKQNAGFTFNQPDKHVCYPIRDYLIYIGKKSKKPLDFM